MKQFLILRFEKYYSLHGERNLLLLVNSMKCCCVVLVRPFYFTLRAALRAAFRLFVLHACESTTESHHRKFTHVVQRAGYARLWWLCEVIAVKGQCQGHQIS